MNGSRQVQPPPGFRHIIHDISESGGPLVQLREVVADLGVDRLVEMLNVGLDIYLAGDVMFVANGDIRLLAEVLDRMDEEVAAGRVPANEHRPN